jgi:signal peptidase I
MANRHSGYDREHRGLIRRIRAAIGFTVLVLVLFCLVLGFAAVRDDGMRPTVSSGSVAVYLRFARDFRRGELVCLRLPDGSPAVRRIVAVQGDRVDLRGGIAYINGLAERGSYSFTRTDRREDGPIYPVILRAGEYFVLGDSRETAVDSRSFGPVRADELLGRPLF